MPSISRRQFLRASSASALATLTETSAVAAAKAPATLAPHHSYEFFTPDEAAFVEAAAARLIPADDADPSALEAGVPAYIDRQLAGAWGADERLYRSGPWLEGAPSQGYQLPYTPAELFRNAVRAINEELGQPGLGG